MTSLPYTVFEDTRPKLGLVVLQSDETIEDELRRTLPDTVSLNVSRVPSSTRVTLETLGAMEQHLAQAASLFPDGKNFDVVGYACTSASAQIGSDRVAELIRAGTRAQAVTEPVSALIAACRAGGMRRIAFLSPYIEPVSAHLRRVLADHGIDTPKFGSFNEADERRVAHIDPPSLIAAARSLMRGAQVDALFSSCTNVKMFRVIPELQTEFGVPILSSNLVIGWHMLHRAGALPEGRQAWHLLAQETACRNGSENIF